MKTIPLTRGKTAIIDDEDYERLAKHKWRVNNSSPGKWYAVTKINGDLTYMHRIILPVSKEQEVDHINGDGLDNRRENLRPCIHPQNGYNRGLQPHSSCFKGVSWNRKDRKWRARIMKNGRSDFIGNFDREEEAARAYDAKARELFGEFALLNFKQERKHSLEEFN